MQTITALALDSPEGLTLLESIIEDNNISLKIIPLRSFTDASTYLNLAEELPEAMIISSGVILREGNEKPLLPLI